MKTQKIPFKTVKIGQTFRIRYIHHWKNDYGTFCEDKVGEFKKIDKKFSYSRSDEDGIELEPNDMVDILENERQ